MATVPKLVRSVDTAPIPGVKRVRQELDFSPIERAQANQVRSMQQFGEALGDVGRVANYHIAKAVQEERDKADQTAALEYDTGLTEWVTKRVYDPQSGALTKKGESALGLPEQVMDEFNKHADKLEEKLGTDRQREAAARIRAQQTQSLDMTLRRHTFSEIQRYQTDTLNASVEAHANAAVLAKADPAQVAAELAQAHAAIDAMGDKVGMPANERDNKKKAVGSLVYSGVVEGLLNENKIPAARAYFEETKDKLTPQALERLNARMRTGTVDYEAQHQSDAILQAYPGDLKRQKEEVAKIDDPDIRKGAMQLVEHEHAVRKGLEDEAQKAARIKALNYIDQGGDIRNVPGWSDFDSDTRGAIYAEATRKARGVVEESDPQTYYELVQRAMNPDLKERERFFDPSQTNLLLYASKLSRSDLKQFMDLQVRGGLQLENQQRATLVNAAAQNKMVDEALMSMGMDPTPKQAPGPNASAKEKAAYSQADVDRVVAFRRGVREAVAALEATQGKQATDEQVQKVVDQLRKPIGTTLAKKSVFGNTYATKYKFEASSVADIPKETFEQIKQTLVRRGMPVTAPAVLALYRSYIGASFAEK